MSVSSNGGDVDKGKSINREIGVGTIIERKS